MELLFYWDNPWPIWSWDNLAKKKEAERGTKMNELKNELRIELSCGRCGLTKVVTVNLDEDGVFTIPNKFCPNDLSELSRDVLRQFVSEPKPKSTEELVEKHASLSEEAFEITKNIKKSNAQTLQEVRSGLSDEPTENKAGTSNAISRPARLLDVPKHGANRSKKT